jgi:hypothetical protein
MTLARYSSTVRGLYAKLSADNFVGPASQKAFQHLALTNRHSRYAGARKLCVATSFRDVSDIRQRRGNRDQ